MLEELESLRVALTGISCRKEYQTTQKEIMNSVIRIIEEQPTAFDKEKVIEELTDRKNDADNQAAKYDEAGDIVNMDLQDMAARCYANTIEIVEKGGV